jgi:glycosyltransferase involved in cell wall biosynthesis
MKKVIVAHPERQHSFQLATALKKSGMLYKYVTTVYDKPSSFLMRLVKKFLGSNNLERANKRRCKALEDSDVVQFCEWQGMLALLILRIDRTLFFENWWRKYYNGCFQKNLAKYIIKHKDEISAVISYDTSSDILFDILDRNAPEIVKIIDHAHPSRFYLHDVYKTVDSGPFRITYESEAGGFLKDRKVAEKFKDEILKADFHIVASSFSKKAAMYSGVPENKIAVCPYGVDTNKFKPAPNKNNSTFKVLFVGQVNQRKGIYQLLEAAKRLNGNDIQFDITGRGREFHAELYEPYRQYVNFYGHVSFEQLLDLFANSHIFVFPTLGEGYGLVLLEALSAGLPVITTPNCAGTDIIKDGYNGFIVDAGDTEALQEKIIWFKNHPDTLKIMSNNAIASIQNYTWEHYYNKIVEAVKQMII